MRVTAGQRAGVAMAVARRCAASRQLLLRLVLLGRGCLVHKLQRRRRRRTRCAQPCIPSQTKATIRRRGRGNVRALAAGVSREAAGLWASGLGVAAAPLSAVGEAEEALVRSRCTASTDCLNLWERRSERQHHTEAAVNGHAADGETNNRESESRVEQIGALA